MDLTRLTAPELVQLVNTVEPTSTTVRQVKQFRESWGLRAANSDGTLNFYRTLACLRLQWEEKVADATPFDQLEYIRRWKQQQKASARDIGEIPPVSDLGLRRACDESLELFLKTCFPDKFNLPFSTDHREIIQDIQRVIHTGGNEAYACERGFGKTQVSLGAATWGTLSGKIEFAMIIGANAEMATVQREGLKRRLETSDELFALYPEICYPMRCLAGSTKQTATYRGKLLRMRSRPDLVLPCIPDAPGSEAVISCTGIDSGSIRGRHYDRTDGRTVRPQLVMLDDPQDDESAKQEATVKSRSLKIRKAVTGLKGPGQKLAILMPCTCIVKNDLAYEFTDRTIRPEWGGRRVKALKEMPDDLDAEFPLWHQYDELRREDLAAGDKTRARATQFYVDNHFAMNQGAKVTWPERVEMGCIDALQSLMDKFLDDPISFSAEQQQDPQGDDDLSTYLDTKQIATRFNGLRQNQFPPGVLRVTTGIDVQEHLLYFVQIAWSDRLTGYLVNWGTFPRQPTLDFHHLKPPRKIAQWIATQYPGQAFTWEEKIALAIRALYKQLPRPPKPVDDKTPAIEFGTTLIDWKWHKVRELIGEIAHDDEFAGVMIPAGGLSVGGNDIPVNERRFPKTSGSYRPSPDVHWYFNKRGKDPRNVVFDANFYRSQFQKGLAIEPGGPGSITYNATFADNVLASHLGAKTCRKSVDTKREAEIWTPKPNVDQDHWLDCSVMARVGVEVDGFRIGRTGQTTKKVKKKVTQDDINNRIRGRR